MLQLLYEHGLALVKVTGRRLPARVLIAQVATTLRQKGNRIKCLHKVLSMHADKCSSLERHISIVHVGLDKTHTSSNGI